MRRAAIVGAIAIAMLASSSCGIGAKEALSRQLTRATIAAIRSGTATAIMDLEVVPITPKGIAVPGPPRIPSVKTTGVAAMLDFLKSRAAVGGTAGRPDTAALMFDHFLILQRRATRRPAPSSFPIASQQQLVPSNIALLSPASLGYLDSGAQIPGNVGARRPWVQFDYSTLPRKGGDRIAGNFGITPSLIVLLLAGSLSGSVHRRDHVKRNGEGTTYYRFNIGRDKAVRGLPEKAREDITKMFRANAVSGVVYHARAWIGTDGRPRRIEVELPQKLTNRDKATLKVTLDITGYGDRLDIALPASKDVAKVTDLGSVVRSSA
jgi:hypothetical protein